MAIAVRATTDPQQVLREAGAFLEGDPVRHNLVLTLLHARVADPEPGRYWLVERGGDVVGVGFQSPLHFIATATPMPTDAITALVDAIVDDGVVLPGVSGEAATAARFAGQWAEKTGTAARPVQGQRIYEVRRVTAPGATEGGSRRATGADRDLLVAWAAAFQVDIGEAVGDEAETVRRRVAGGQLWLWEDGSPTAMAGLSDAAAGVVRVGPVYTPPDARRRGYASALVAAISAAALAAGHRCILYTDLANPTSNAIYRAIGYRAITEALRYTFMT